MAKDTAGIPPQLALDIRWDREVTLDDFVPGANADALAAVWSVAAGRTREPVYLYGDSATGKSHLLQAACRQVHSTGAGAVYLPLDALQAYAPAVLEGMEAMGLVAVDAVDRVAGSREWQEALFHLFNRVRDAGGAFLAAGRQRPDRLGLELPDLASRLRWGPVFRLTELGDADKKQALAARGRHRGLEVPDEVLDYLLRHHRRDADFLFAALDRLDDASLRAQRRLTIPFVRRVLAQR